jgi:alpha-glucoside transport system substrate-binding protein
MLELRNLPSFSGLRRSSSRMLGAIGFALLASAAQAQSVDLPPEAVRAAQDFAKTLNGGQAIGGKVSVLGVNGGRELEMLKAAWKPFEEATGVTIDYTGTTDFAAVLQTRVAAGDPPDLAGSTNINNLVRYAKQGALQDVGAMVGMDKFTGNFDAGLLSAATIDGKLFGVWTELNNFMVFYNVHTYDGPKENVTWADFDGWAKKRAEAGSPPWCYSDERGASSGAVGGNWIQAYVLKNSGPDKLKALAAGELSWTSPEVKQAFEAFGAMATDPKMVAGGPVAAMSTQAVKIGTGLFSEPPQCSVLLWGTYAASLTRLIYPNVEPIKDLDFMRIPGKPEFANYETFGGTLYLPFKNTPQVAAFLTYLASKEGQSLVAASGNWTVANQKVEGKDYPNLVMQKAREALLNANVTLVAQPTQVVNPPVIQALWKGVVRYVLDPSSLDEVLQSIDAAK